MTQKVNGHVGGAEWVGGDNQFFTVTATVSGDAAGKDFTTVVPTQGFDGNSTFDVDVNKTLFDVAVEIIELYETPIILGSLTGSNLVFRFATNRVASFQEAKDTGDTKQTVLADVLEAGLMKALGVASGVSITVVAAETI